MTRDIPRIGQSMNEARYFVGPKSSLTEARELMQAHGVRHLPVVEGGAVVGMLSLGDLFVMEATFARDPETSRVEEAMSKEIYTVAPDTPLAEVATEMARRGIGSTIILEDGRLRGIFTATDACRVLGELLTK